MGYTPEQKRCVEQMRGPVDVCAGAGSGKTFTLTQRIAYALKTPGTGVDDIDQVLAITFTNKAAAELKGRVRATLRSEGLLEQAQRVDSAWISTIHGMCSRILKSCALEVGIDPGFELIDAQDNIDLLEIAIDRKLEELGRAENPYSELFATFPLHSAGGFSNDTNVFSLVEGLIIKAQSLPGGWDDLEVIACQESPSDLARQFLTLCEDELAFSQNQAPNNTTQTNCERAQDGIDALREFLESDDKSIFNLMRAFSGLSTLNKPRSGAEKEIVGEFQDAHKDLVRRAAHVQAGTLLQQAFQLAQEVSHLYEQEKRARGVLDNNDLIKQALLALDHPEIAARYTNKFRLVMIDEFQDTDLLQLAIVKRLAGANQQYLCTVGDAQQSIYAFRGADVATYREYQRSLQDPAFAQAGGTPELLQLSKNFRSHGDILAFVKKVCAQSQVFGDSFLDLATGYNKSDYRANEPRIQVHITAVPPNPPRGKGGIANTVPVQAEQIVAYFRSMKEAGHPLSSMALLLGGMTYALQYADALAQAGFECVISGGSLFAQTAEAQMVGLLARAITNPQDTEALYNVLAGSLFCVAGDELLELATLVDEEGQAHFRELHEGTRAVESALWQLKRQGQQQEPSAYTQAIAVLCRGRKALNWQPLSGALLDVLRESGELARLESQGATGLASIANYLKALRYLEEYEQCDGAGPSTVAKMYCRAMAEGVKDKPGALNAAGQEAIKIMTIHASKGLEFPIVALANFSRDPKASSLLTARVGNKTYAGLLPSGGKIGNVSIEPSHVFDLVESEDLTLENFNRATSEQRLCMMRQATLDADAQERQRLFYVGATRAKEALGVFINVKDADDPSKVYTNTFGDVVTALFGNDAPEVGECWADFGGSAPALVRKSFISLDAKPAQEESQEPEGTGEAFPASAAASRAVYQSDPALLLRGEAVPPEDTGLFSYTALSQEHFDLVVSLSDSITESDDEGEGEDVTALFGRRFADADKATNFGSAFHRLAQLTLERSPEFSRQQVNQVAAAYEVKDTQRLARSLEKWLASRACQRAQRAASVFAEMPFDVWVPSVGKVLEGAFDALCIEGEAAVGKRAYVVDYKTGGSPAETAQLLFKKHELQAQCYAYVLLMQGYGQVELDFVRVEQDDPAGTDSLQTVHYSYQAADALQLEAVIAACAENLPRS